MRTIIDITEEQMQELSYLCTSQKIPRAEAIRRAITLYLREAMPKDKNRAFGIWKNKPVDALSYQARLRDEWS